MFSRERHLRVIHTYKTPRYLPLNIPDGFLSIFNYFSKFCLFFLFSQVPVIFRSLHIIISTGLKKCLGKNSWVWVVPLLIIENYLPNHEKPIWASEVWEVIWQMIHKVHNSYCFIHLILLSYSNQTTELSLCIIICFWFTYISINFMKSGMLSLSLSYAVQ